MVSGDYRDDAAEPDAVSLVQEAGQVGNAFSWESDITIYIVAVVGFLHKDIIKAFAWGRA